MTSSSVCTLANTGMNWGDIFTYRNGKLYWKVKAAAHAVVGSEAWCYDKSSGYVLVRYKRRLRRAHCIIWEMHNGPVPKGMVIDHDDRNRTNNRIDNLNLVTQLQNNRNKTKSKRNTSGVTGVYWHKRDQRWVASIRIEGKLKQLGQTTCLVEDSKLRKEAERKHGFHKNHGK